MSEITGENPHQLAMQALLWARGDNLERAEAAFRGMTEGEMDRPYGESGKTRRQIVAEYRSTRVRYDAAIAWLKSIPEPA